jgi:asparagine synthase (glutamine-hydrolysing)
MISKAAHESGYKVVLTGEGADEIFAGYSHVMNDASIYTMHNREVVKRDSNSLGKAYESDKVSRGFLTPSDTPLPLKDVENILGFVPTWMKAFSANSTKFSSLYSYEFKQQFMFREPFRAFLDQLNIQGKLAGKSPIHQSLYLWSKAILLNYILRIAGDAVEMAHSLEGRLPFLDHKLVELANKIPADLKIKNNTEKYILREAARPFVTNTIYRQKKHPFFAPPSTLQMDGPFHELLQDTLRSSKLNDLPFYNKNAVVSLLDELPNMDYKTRSSIDFVLVEILSACTLQQHFAITSI